MKFDDFYVPSIQLHSFNDSMHTDSDTT